MEQEQHLWTVIMAGGTGSRFWPVSNTDSPKQFLDVMGTGKTMLQTTFERMAQICPVDHIIIVTGEQYSDRVRDMLPNLKPHQVVGEPLRRGTAPCIAYAAALIGDIDPLATVIVTPADHAIFNLQNFVADIRQAVDTVASHDWIITLGATPVRPETGYGYIQFDTASALPGSTNMHRVVTFTEKPPLEMARQFIASGEFFWNAGILVWRLSVLREAYYNFLPNIAHAFFGLSTNSSHELVEQVYSQSESISVDFGIMEKADNVHVLAASFGWSDVETWNTLYDVANHDESGNATIGNANIFTYNTNNCIITVPTDTTVVAEGLDGYIIASSGNTIMICRRQNEEMIFKFVSDVELKQLIDKK